MNIYAYTDREFLTWLRDRLVNKYEEHENINFVLKLEAIIDALPKDQHTPNVSTVKKVS